MKPHSPFRIEHTPGNRAGTVPPHYDVFTQGSDDSVCTVWDSHEFAQLFVQFLEEWAEKGQAERVQAGVA